MIPYAQTYTSTVTARIPKLVDCEGCQQQYVYFLERTASGEGTSFLFLDNDGAKQRAHEAAQAELLYRLERNCDPVPCPRCGHYQQHMFKRAKDQHKKWMFTAGLSAILVAIPVALVAFVAQGVGERSGSANATFVGYLSAALAIGGVVLGLLLLILRFRMVALYDPNDQPAADRIEEGRERALTIEEFAAILARQQAAEGQSASGPHSQASPG